MTNHCTSEAHLSAVKRILRYLEISHYDTRGVTHHIDADWVRDQDDRHSTSGNVFILGGGAICWSSKKQAVVSLAIVEAEYIALSAAAQEAAWLQKLFLDIPIKGNLVLSLPHNNYICT